MRAWLQRLEANDWFYFAGLGLLFAGLALGVSVATALGVVGGVLVVLSTVRAYFVTWLAIQQPRKK